MIRSFQFTALMLIVLLFAAVDPAFALSAGQHAIQTDSGRTVAILFGLGALGAALTSNAPTLLDMAKRMDPSGGIATIVELLSQTNEMLADMSWKEGNLPTGHRTTIRTGLPDVYWRLLNQGVTPSKSKTAQVDEQAGMLEAWSEVDVDLAKLNGNVNAFRMSEARAFLEAMNQEMQQTIIYGNAGLAPEEFTGFATRYSSLTGAENGKNIIDAAGNDSDLTSIYIVAWGDDTVHGIVPKGSAAGLQHNDYGEQTIQVANGIAGARLRAYQERWQWKAGLVVKDWRYVVRIANLDISALAGTSNVPDLTDFLEHAISLLPNRAGRPVIYANRTIMRFLRKQDREQVTAGGGLTFDNVDGRVKTSFDGIPLRTVDAILNTEARVT